MHADSLQQAISRGLVQQGPPAAAYHFAHVPGMVGACSAAAALLQVCACPIRVAQQMLQHLFYTWALATAASWQVAIGMTVSCTITFEYQILKKILPNIYMFEGGIPAMASRQCA